MVAGEASGDQHAGAVAAELKSMRSDLQLRGIGGRQMEAAGVELIEHSDTLAVMGLTEVIRHLPHHWSLLRSVRGRLRSGAVRLVILVDYPGFNLRIARQARRAGVPVLYYITPQVWAWGAKRLVAMRQTVTRAAVILPFEEKLLREHGINATFVGHPLLDRAVDMPTREEARRRLGIPEDATCLALFPGSRSQEIARHLVDFVAAAEELKRRLPRLHVFVSVASNVEISSLRCSLPLVGGSSFTVLRAADAALCKSGTTTLEAAVAGCPLVIAYRTSDWTYAIARRMVRIPHIGLVNVVAGHEVAREFLQDALRPSSIADALEPLLDRSSAQRQRVVDQLAGVRARLGEPGASRRVAQIASELAG
jgi:lipid-A-disaccharide synthase